jgi:hypothetical protein
MPQPRHDRDADLQGVQRLRLGDLVQLSLRRILNRVPFGLSSRLRRILNRVPFGLSSRLRRILN